MAPRRVLAGGDGRMILPHQLGDFICIFLAVFSQDSWVSFLTVCYTQLRYPLHASG